MSTQNLVAIPGSLSREVAPRAGFPFTRAVHSRYTWQLRCTKCGAVVRASDDDKLPSHTCPTDNDVSKGSSALRTVRRKG